MPVLKIPIPSDAAASPSVAVRLQGYARRIEFENCILSRFVGGPRTIWPFASCLTAKHRLLEGVPVRSIVSHSQVHP